MKTNDLITLWGAPEAPKLTARQISIRLPMIVSAKLSALCELYPRKTKTEIIGDLLTAALEQIEEDFPRIKGRYLPEESNFEETEIYEDDGIRHKYLKLTEKFLRELEQDAGIKEPMQFNSVALIYEDKD